MLLEGEWGDRVRHFVIPAEAGIQIFNTNAIIIVKHNSSKNVPHPI